MSCGAWLVVSVLALKPAPVSSGTAPKMQTPCPPPRKEKLHSTFSKKSATKEKCFVMAAGEIL